MTQIVTISHFSSLFASLQTIVLKHPREIWSDPLSQRLHLWIDQVKFLEDIAQPEAGVIERLNYLRAYILVAPLDQIPLANPRLPEEGIALADRVSITGMVFEQWQLDDIASCCGNPSLKTIPSYSHLFARAILQLISSSEQSLALVCIPETPALSLHRELAKLAPTEITERTQFDARKFCFYVKRIEHGKEWQTAMMQAEGLMQKALVARQNTAHIVANTQEVRGTRKANWTEHQAAMESQVSQLHTIHHHTIATQQEHEQLITGYIAQDQRDLARVKEEAASQAAREKQLNQLADQLRRQL